MDRGDVRLLVADDNPATRATIRRRLATLGFGHVDEAEDGAAALALLERGTYHLVITDWHMPRMTGIDLLRAIRATPAIAHLPVLLVLGYITRALILEAAAAGASGFLARPCVEVTLAEKVEALLGTGHPGTAGPWALEPPHHSA